MDVQSTASRNNAAEADPVAEASDRLGPYVDVGFALGCARLTMSPWAPERQGAIATIHAGLDAGVRLLDTANCYVTGGQEPGANENLVREALSSWQGDSDSVLVATKGGATRTSSGWGRDGRPDSLRRACDASLTALGVKQIGLYQLHQVDPDVPFEESLGAVTGLVAAGKVRMFGVSNVSTEQLAVAAAAGAVSVQDQMSVENPFAGPIIDAARRSCVRLLGWSPLAGVRTDEEAASYAVVADVATRLAATPRQVAIAWLWTLGTHITPIIGPTSPADVEEVAATATCVRPDDIRDVAVDITTQAPR